MDQSNHRLVSENLPLGRLVANALGELERLEYKEITGSVSSNLGTLHRVFPPEEARR